MGLVSNCLSVPRSRSPQIPSNPRTTARRLNNTDEIDLYQRRFIYELSRWLAIA
jgi:hypothetical protein